MSPAATYDLDPLDRRLLDRIQWDFPLVSRPWRALGEEIGLAEAEVIERIGRLKREGLVRQIGPVLDPAGMGCVSCLVAAQVAPSHLERVAALAGSFSEVTHNYQRDHPFNLWFTVIAPSRERLEQVVQWVRLAQGVERAEALPALRRFKIAAFFQVGDGERQPERTGFGMRDAGCGEEGERGPATTSPPPFGHPLSVNGEGAAGEVRREWRDRQAATGNRQPATGENVIPSLPLSEAEGEARNLGVGIPVGPKPRSVADAQDDKHPQPASRNPQPLPLIRRMLDALQQDLPLEEEPFRSLAGQAGVTEEELLQMIRGGLESGQIRRYGALLRHRRVGYRENAMLVWQVAEDRVEEIGRAFSRHQRVTHCYQRPAFDGFPYNLYCMVHGRSRAECEQAAAELAELAGAPPLPLYSTREFKKTSPRY